MKVFYKFKEKTEINDNHSHLEGLFNKKLCKR